MKTKKKYTEWSTDVKLFLLAYNSQITTTFGPLPHVLAFNQKPCEPVIFIANSSKKTQRYFHHPQISKLASGADADWILNKDKKHKDFYQKIAKKLSQNVQAQINSEFAPAPTKNRNICFKPQFYYSSLFSNLFEK